MFFLFEPVMQETEGKCFPYLMPRYFDSSWIYIDIRIGIPDHRHLSWG